MKLFTKLLLAVFFSFVGLKQLAAQPTISSFSPTSGPIGTLITITGTNLDNPTALTINGVTALVISNTGSSLVALAMPTTGTGIISITTGAGSAGSIGNFTVTANRLPNTQQGSKLVGTGNSGASQQGYSVALSADGNTAIIGGYGDNSSTGAAWIYVRSGSNWVQQGNKLVGSSASAGTTYQGSSVALSADGNTAIVGGINWGGTYQGTAWIYVRNGTTWSLEAGNLAKTGETNGVSCYGAAVALSADGNTAVIGGYADNINQGGVWVYKRSGGVWSQQGNKLTASDPVGNPRVGYSLALSADGNTIIAGGYGDNGFNGSAWIFTQSGGTWSQQGNKLLPTGFSGLYFGKSVAISADGNTAIIGADGENASQGAAFIFTRSGSTWSQQGNKLVGTGNSGAAGQGISVCLTADGNTAMVGGYTDNSNAGATWLYTRSGNTWTQQGTKLTGTGNSGNPMFGYAVALSADSKTAIIGGYTDNSSVGAAWLHTPVAGIDANLSALTTTAGTLSPTFAAATTAYTASVINAVSSVTVTPTKADANASIQVQVNAGGYVTVTSGAASSALSLNVGNNAIDVKVTAEDGTTIKIYTITITRSVEPSGNALNFDGSDDFVGINAAGNTATNFTSASTFTIEAWIKPGSNALSSFISHKASTTVVDGYALFVNYGSTSVVGFETKNSGLAATRTINNNVWNHIAFVYNAGTATFYINGLAAGSGAIAITASADQLRFGMLSNGVYAYNGSMDEVRFWNTARTASEIQTNMFAPVSNTATGLIAYYNFDAGSGTALADLTSNTYTGTLNNFALTGTASNWVESYAMVVPTASAATSITSSGFTANWSAPSLGTVDNDYRLDVSTLSNFSTLVPGYSGLRVTGNSQAVTGLSAGVYYYRVSADKTSVTGQGGYSATITAALPYTAPGNAIAFDGTNDYVDVAHSSALNVTKFTLETWFYWSPTTTSDIQFISSKGVEAMELHTAGSSGANGLRFIPRTGVYLDVLNAFTTNAWYHIAVVYDPTSSYAKIYINGIEKSFTLTGSLSSAMVNNTNSFNLGRRITNQFYLKGKLDEFRIWNVVRTQAEVQADMINTINPATSGLVAYYNFDAGTAGATNTGITTLIDGTSNALNGTLTNFALTGSTSNWVESYAMVVPTATAATSTAGISFTANWTAPVVGTVDNYLLDVSTSSTFASAISGSPFTVAGTSKSVTGLTAGTIYYYRVRADKTSVTGQGGYSNAITVTPPIVVSSVTGSIVACAGTASTSYQQFTVAGTGLTNDIVVTAPTDFQVSVTAGSGYGSSVTLTQTSGTVSSTIIYVRSAASATSNGSGNVAISSIGQATINLALSSTINALPTGTLLPATQTICSGTAISNISFSSATTNIKAFSMQTGAATFLNSDQSGIFFDITNNSAQPVLVTNLVIAYLTRNALGANTNASFDVYKTSSATTAVGNYTTSSAWTKINSTSFTFPSGTAASTYYNLSADLAANSFTLAAGASIGMYVVANTAGFSIIYRNAATSTTSDTDGLLTMTSRVRSTGLFLQDNTARSFFGNINYQIFSLSRSNTTNVTGTGNAGNTTDTANVISGTLTNTTNTPQTTTYTYNIINSNNCAATVTANVIVNPVPNVATISNQTVCAGTSVTAINFTGNVTGTSYSWTNDNTTIGLAASGTGDIASFTATNTGSTPITATITVTPSYTNAGSTCTGSAITFTVTVNPKPTATLGTIVGVTTAATSFDVPYSGLTASPNQYSIIAGSPTALPSFAAVTNASLTTSPLAVTIPASSAGTYNFNFSLRNSTTGCVSDAMPFSLTVLSTNADLSALTTTAGTLSPTFAAATTAYTASVINAVSSVTVTATKADANASIQVQVNSGGYATVASGAASSALSLNVGSNTIDVKVTAEDGTTIKTYTITVTRAAAASTNANLSALDISAGTLAPTFGASIITYTASVAVSSITVTPTKADANASIQVQVNSGGYATVASGAASSSLSLNLGSNTVDVKVTAEDGTTIKTYSITVTRAMTAPGNALAFDGTDDYVSVPHNAVLNVTKFTLETWFYWSPATTSDIQFISCKGLEAMEIHTAGASGANGLRFIPRTGVYLDVTNAFTTNAWYHIAVVYDPTSSYAKIYINGIERSFSLTGSLSSAMVNNATALNIGRRTTGQYYLKGKLDEFRIWNVVRTQAEIQASMMNTINAATSGLVAYYNFDAGTASGTNTGITTLTDGTSNALNGTLTNIALTGSTSNWVESYAMVIPTTTVATSIAGTSFIANWTAPTVGTVDNYLLDVSTSSTFASAIAGSPFTVAGASKSLTSLTAGTNYYYRVRADKTSVTGQGGYSATITASTISNNSSLSNLVLSTGTLSPTFATATTSYTTSVSVPSITVTPTAAAGTSTITVNGNAITSGAASGSIALSLGSNTITVVVTAQDASTTTYTITVTRSLSTNANLGSLVLSSGTLAPTFAAATISYTASVTNATTSITVTPTLPANTTSTITVNGNTVASGVASGSIALSVGANTITTIVTAEDGSTTKTYTVTVTRVASATATLSSLVLNAGSLSPAFASATIAYTASVSYGTTAFTVTPTVADATATVTVNGNAVTSGSASGSIALNVGSNTITTIVTAQDGITTKTYTVTVTRGAVSPGNALGFSGSKVTVSALNISPGVYNQLTISVWANRTAGTGSYASIVSNDDGGYDRAITTYSDNTYHIFAGRDIATGVPAVLNSWEYITVYWSGTAVKMYKNGVLVLNTSGETASSSSIGTIIGNNNNNLSYPGRIDEVSLWNRELTAGEVTANMTSSINVATATGLIGYYTFDQGTAGGNNAGITTLIDNSTGGRNGVLTSGFALTGTGTNWIESYAMVVPVATTATNVSTTSFTANWTAPVTGTVDNGYVVDVSTVSTFASVITGSPFAVASGASLNVSGLAPATNYYYRVRADKTSVTGQGAYTATTNVTTLTTLVWNGSVSNAWGTAANWTPASVPTSADPVTIPTGASNMPVQVTATESANGISIQSGASLTIDGTLQVTKAVSNSGSLSGTGTLILNGTTQQALTGNISIGNLTLNNSGGAIINSGMVSITGTLTPTLGTLTTGGFLTLKSDANGTARIAPVTGAISGNVTVERYIPAGKRGFRLLTPTVTTTTFIKGNWQEGANNTSLLYASNQNPVAGYGTHITGSATGLNGFDATLTGNASLFKLNNGTQIWSSIANTNATNLTAGNAYRLLVRGNRAFDLSTTSNTNTATTLRATGTLLTGTATFGSASSTPASLPTLATGIGQYSFIGNPYASSIDWNAVSRTELTGYYWIWDPTLSNNGAYVSCFTDGTKSNGSSAVTTAIQPGQAFFVVNSSNVAARQLVITEANKTTGNTNVFRTQTGTSTMGIQLFLSSNMNGTSQDGANILFNSSFSNAVNDDDAGKFINVDENIAVQRGNSLMSIERRNVPANPNDTVFLKTWQLTQNNYMLRIASNNFDATLNAYLQDSYLNNETLLNLSGTTDINFTTTSAVASTAANRFSIVFRSNGALPVTITNLKAYQKTAGIQVEWNTQNEANMSVYEVEKSIDGSSFIKAGTVAAIGSSSYNWFDASPINGNNYYRIKLVDKNGTFRYTQMVNVKIGGIKNVFSIVGNPVKNKTVILQLDNVEKASYSLVVYNNLGQQVASKIIVHAGGSATETIALGNVSAGTYQLSIIGKNVKETRTLIVE